MAFCMNCGKELPDGAKFCCDCGTPVNQQTSPNKRTTFYDGEIHKCPSCGGVLQSFEHKCRICGYELRGAKSSDVVKEFAEKISKTKSKAKKIELISNFYVPNTKEDIYEFFILAVSNINTDPMCEDAWESKLEQTYHKAKLSFGNTPEFEYLQKIYNDAVNKNKRRDEQKALKKALKIFAYALLCIIGIVMLILGFVLPTHEDDPLHALAILGYFPLFAPIFIQIFLDAKKVDEKKEMNETYEEQIKEEEEQEETITEKLKKKINKILK